MEVTEHVVNPMIVEVPASETPVTNHNLDRVQLILI